MVSFDTIVRIDLIGFLYVSSIVIISLFNVIIGIVIMVRIICLLYLIRLRLGCRGSLMC